MAHNSPSGPDVTDVAMTIRHIEEFHRVLVLVTLNSSVFDGPSIISTISAHRVSKLGEASIMGEPCVALSAEWPCVDHRDFWSCLYNGLLTLDTLLSRKIWDQLLLPFTADVPPA